jgi:hypothetical protein
MEIQRLVVPGRSRPGSRVRSVDASSHRRTGLPRHAPAFRGRLGGVLVFDSQDSMSLRGGSLYAIALRKLRAGNEAVPLSRAAAARTCVARSGRSMRGPTSAGLRPILTALKLKRAYRRKVLCAGRRAAAVRHDGASEHDEELPSAERTPFLRCVRTSGRVVRPVELECACAKPSRGLSAMCRLRPSSVTSCQATACRAHRRRTRAATARLGGALPRTRTCLEGHG